LEGVDRAGVLPLVLGVLSIQDWYESE
jgi:hypothetical protein